MTNPFIAQALTMTPAAAYSFDADIPPTVTDSSSNARHAAYVNGTPPAAPSLHLGDGPAISLPDTRFVRVPAAAMSKIYDFSIAFWISYETTANTVVLERNGNAGWSVQTGNAASIPIGLGVGCLGLASSIGATAAIALASNAPLNSGLPFFVVVAIGSSVASSKVYVNGVNATVATPSTTSPGWTPGYGSTTSADVGSRNGTFAFGGLLDDLVFFDRQLTPAEVAQLYAAGAGSRQIKQPFADVFVSAPNLTPVGTLLRAPLLMARDVEFGGDGVIAGSIKEKNTPANTPLRRRVLLIDERSRITIRETWSDAVTGNYEFRGVKQGVKYTVISYDHLHNYSAVIVDNQDAT